MIQSESAGAVLLVLLSIGILVRVIDRAAEPPEILPRRLLNSALSRFRAAPETART